MKHTLILTALVTTVLALGLLSPAFVVGRGDEEADREYVSDPANVPVFDIMTPKIELGEEGEFTISLTNRYHRNITRTNLTIEIYRWVLGDESKEISEMENKALFVFLEDLKSPSFIAHWGTVGSGNSSAITRLSIKTEGKTPTGSYFIRLQLHFNYTGEDGNATYVMKSRGHFTDGEWEDATDSSQTGGINLTMLGVDGIIPDTSFSVLRAEPDDSPGFALASVCCAVVVVVLGRKKKLLGL